MEIIRDSGIGEVLALCGGCCSCATCHVYVDPQALPLMPEISEGERALLDSLDYARAESRLSCQLPFADRISEVTFTIAPEE
jgi:ferredoxin, 2Fe-2S